MIVGIAFVLVASIGTLDFAQEFELITGEPYSHKILLFVLFTSGVMGNYLFLFRLWKNTNERSNIYSVIIFSAIIIISTTIIIKWLLDVSDQVQLSFQEIAFPTDVDELTTEIRTSLLQSVTIMFGLLGAVGFVSFLGSLIYLKSILKN